MMKRTIPFLLSIIILASCQNNKTTTQEANYDPIKASQDRAFAHEQIKKNNPAGLLKLWEIATESISAEDSEIASEQVRGYLYSKPELWIRAFSTVDFLKFKKEFESIDFDTYRFTPDGELPEAVAAKKIVSDLQKMKGKNQQEQVLVDYLITYYSAIMKNDNNSSLDGRRIYDAPSSNCRDTLRRWAIFIGGSNRVHGVLRSAC